MASISHSTLEKPASQAHRLGFAGLGLVSVFVCELNRHWEDLRQQRCISHSSRGWEVQDQDRFYVQHLPEMWDLSLYPHKC